MNPDLKISYLMTAKICHDLAAPLGSLGMGIESLPLDDLTKTLFHSYFLSNFKLRFYRLFMTPNEEGPSVFEFIPLLNEYAKNQNITINWSKNISESEEIKGDVARLLMGMVYLLMEPLVRGGDCTITLTKEKLEIISKGPLCPLREMYKKILSNDIIGNDDFNGRNIFPIFLMELVKKLGFTFQFEHLDNKIIVTMN
jgi:hypothetical protein